MKHDFLVMAGGCVLILAGLISSVPAVAEAAGGKQPAGEPATRSTGFWAVGAASDGKCHFDDIQDAIDATKANDGGFSTINVRVSGSASDHLGNIYSVDATQFENVETFRVIGGHADCDSSSPEPDARTVLDANGNGRVFDLLYDAADGDPVRTIRLENLEIRGGDAPFAGGGIRIEGHSGRHRVQLTNVDIHDNVTRNLGSGGGISIEATAGSDSPTNWVMIDGGSTIRNNTAAGTGGGVACFNTVSNANPPILLFETPISGNQADFNGGGLSVNGCQQVSVRMQGLVDARTHGPLSTIESNQAGVGSDGNGGGVYVTNGGEVIVEASGTEDPAIIGRNSADNGGGVAVTGSGSTLTLVNMIVASNEAEDSGGGVLVDAGAAFTMGRQGGVTGFPGKCLDATDRCSRIVANEAGDPDSSQTGAGAAIMVDNGASAEVSQTFITSNDSMRFGGSIIFVRGASSSLHMEGAVIDLNRVFDLGETLMAAVDGALLRVRWSTIAGNFSEDSTATVFTVHGQESAPTTLNFDSSIVWQPGATIVSAGDHTGTAADCVIGHDSAGDSGFDSANFYSQIDPRLRDPENGDLRLHPNSPAVDYCDDNFAPQFNDMFNNPRGVDVDGPLIEPPDSVPGGTFDIGAHELQELTETIFQDRFEDG